MNQARQKKAAGVHSQDVSMQHSHEFTFKERVFVECWWFSKTWCHECTSLLQLLSHGLHAWESLISWHSKDLYAQFNTWEGLNSIIRVHHVLTIDHMTWWNQECPLSRQSPRSLANQKHPFFDSRPEMGTPWQAALEKQNHQEIEKTHEESWSLFRCMLQYPLWNQGGPRTPYFDIFLGIGGVRGLIL